jgi:hypothetical protein
VVKDSTTAGHGEHAASAGTAAAPSTSAAWWAALQSEAAVAFAQTNPKSLDRRAVPRGISTMECDKKKTQARPAEAAT